MRWRDWLVSQPWKKLIATLAEVAAASTMLCAIAGGTSHAISLNFAMDGYDMVFGCGTMPDPPLGNHTVCAFLVGMIRTWWIGLAWAPLVFAIAGYADADMRPSRLARAMGLGIGAMCLAVIASLATQLDNSYGLGWVFFETILNFGYPILNLGLTIMGLALRPKTALSATTA
ncbi:MAG: hypothetical protein IT207_11630 [Fimbriimonadaceae bacterium]|nr:hypothetical protein [Fimbriimonadaceae bacterium]